MVSCSDLDKELMHHNKARQASSKLVGKWTFIQRLFREWFENSNSLEASLVRKIIEGMGRSQGKKQRMHLLQLPPVPILYKSAVVIYARLHISKFLCVASSRFAYRKAKHICL